MIPHIMTGILYSINVQMAGSSTSTVELLDFSIFDSSRDTYEWVEKENFRYTVIPTGRRGHHYLLTMYLQLDEEQSVPAIIKLVRTVLKQNVCHGLRGVKIHHLGKPHFLLRLNSIEDRIAKEEEIRPERIFNGLIYS